MNSDEYSGGVIDAGYPGVPITLFNSFYTPWGWGPKSISRWEDERFLEVLDEATGTIDPVERKPLLEELFVTALDDAAIIPAGFSWFRSYWWPWVKNYWGEINEGGICQPPYELMWIDPDMKADMGY